MARPVPTRRRAPRPVARVALLIMLVAGVARSASGDPSRGSASAQAAPSDSVSVYLLTIGQGDLVWERFGHNAIGVRDQRAKSDVVYNWGLFDFEQPGFIRRFVLGEMTYWMAGMDAGPSIADYARQNRAIVIQELNLSGAQIRELVEFLQWNSREENRYYRYDYYRDNCSTRVRDALDRVLGGALRGATDSIVTPVTYRRETRRLMADDPLIATGIDLGLGRPADRRISAWEEMFIPMRMRDRLRGLMVRDDTGGLVPLVRAERTVFEAVREREAAAPPNRAPLALVLGIGIAGIVLFLARRRPGGRTSTAARASLVVWSIAVGVVGLLLVFLWAGTRHVHAYGNLNVLQYNPLWLGLAVALPFAGRHAGAARWTMWLATAAGCLTILAMIAACIPAIRQDNLAVLLLAAPVNLAVAGIARRLVRARPAV
jgi:hypothetical protein